MDNGEPINIFKLGSGDEVCVLDKSLMRKYRHWIGEAMGVEQRELLRDNWKRSGKTQFRIN